MNRLQWSEAISKGMIKHWRERQKFFDKEVSHD